MRSGQRNSLQKLRDKPGTEGSRSEASRSRFLFLATAALVRSVDSLDVTWEIWTLGPTRLLYIRWKGLRTTIALRQGR